MQREEQMPFTAGTTMNSARTWAVLISLVALGAAMHTSATPVAEAQAPTAAARGPAAGTPDANAKSRLKAMSDYVAAQQAFSFAYDTYLEVVTTDNQKLGLASSGTIAVNRPDKLRATRTGGFADVEFLFDGKTLTMLGKNANAYGQAPAVGTIDQLLDTLRQKYNRPIPGGDLLMSNIHDQLMPEVTNAKDLGSGVIDGVECDHLAFRTKDVDWQIWVAQGERPYPCRYVITSTQVSKAPGYSIDVRNWKTEPAPPASFAFKAPANAKKVNPGELKDFDELPAIFTIAKAKRAGVDLRLLPAAVSEFFVSTLEAVVGRPLTPVSVSGVARRTSRRCSADVYDC
jgi:hypothetical protein